MLALAAPAGICTYMAYLWITRGNPMLFATAERKTWNRQLTGPWSTLEMQVQHLAAQAPWSYWQMLLSVDLGIFVLIAVLTAIFARRQPLSFSLYSVGLLATCVILPPLGPQWPDPMTSAARYLALSFPVFLGLAQVIDRRPALGTLVVGTGLMVEAALASFYLSNGWLG
jgi:hypothetical protein